MFDGRMAGQNRRCRQFNRRAPLPPHVVFFTAPPRTRLLISHLANQRESHAGRPVNHALLPSLPLLGAPPLPPSRFPSPAFSPVPSPSLQLLPSLGHPYPPPVLLPSRAARRPATGGSQGGGCRARGGGHLHEGRWGARGGGAPAAASGEVRCEAAPAPVTSVLNSIESIATPVPPHPRPSTMG